MKGLFIVLESLQEHSGISKKIISQVNGFKNNGVDMEISYLSIDNTESKRSYSGRMVNDNMIENFSNNNLISKIQRIISYNSLLEYIKNRNIGLIYIRYTHFANPFFISFLMKMKKINVVVLLEVPTFPYDSEYQNERFNKRLILGVEKLSRKYFKYCVDKIITFQDYKTIFGVDTIKTSNGIDIDNNQIAYLNSNKTETLNLIGVAGLSIWHGFDRIIEGLHLYYSENPQRKVVFHVVGDTTTPTGIEYQKLINKFKLSEYVILYGNKFGDELNAVYSKCQIGIGSLGIHRIGIKSVQPLKNREYCARGLPFIYSFIDEDFDHKNFILKESFDDNPVDINKIVEFWDSNTFDPVEIRKYAEENLTWNLQIKRILEKL